MRVYIDDLRTPKGNFDVVVRSFEDFITLLCNHGNDITYVSFDHDLGEDGKGEELPSGLDCAKFLVDHCIDNDIDLPEWNVHSANPVGAANINGYLLSYKNFRNKVDN